MRPMHRIAAVLVSAALPVTAAAAQKHPHFDDGGTLVWHTKLAAAKEAAQKADRLIFVEYGREA